MTTPRSGGSRRFTELGRLLRDRREEMGMSRQRVAEMTGLSYPYVAQLEGGHRAPSAEAAEQLARTLKLSHSELAEVVRREKGGREEQRSGFLPNPAYVRQGSVPADRAQALPAAHLVSADESSTADAVLHEAAVLIERLPAEQRLELLGRLQARVLNGVVAEQVKRAVPGSS